MVLEIVYEHNKRSRSLCATASSSRRFVPTAPARARARLNGLPAGGTGGGAVHRLSCCWR